MQVLSTLAATVVVTVMTWGYCRAVERLLRGRDWRYVLGWFVGTFVSAIVVAAAAGATSATAWEVVLLILGSLGTLTAWATLGARRVRIERMAR